MPPCMGFTASVSERAVCFLMSRYSWYRSGTIIWRAISERSPILLGLRTGSEGTGTGGRSRAAGMPCAVRVVLR